ncbi:MAG: hypothetical protein AAB630_01765 [Patescibacteria group bacterium]
MTQKFIGISLFIALLTLAAFPVLATNGATSTNATSTKERVKPAVLSSLDVACIKSAVEKRDTAIIAAFDTLHDSAKTALTARKTALLAAWDITDRTARRAALKAAWKTYGDAIKSARATFRDARLAAWKQFRTDSKACGKSATSDDKTESGIDAKL